MRLVQEEARRRFTAARVGRLATADAAGHPHQVPVTFASRGDVVVTAVDNKPKQHRKLRRLHNIHANPAVCLLTDEYGDDWTTLWWVRADGEAQVMDDAEAAEAAPLVDWLVEKYPQYRDRRPEGPVIRIRVRTWVGWAYGDG